MMKRVFKNLLLYVLMGCMITLLGCSRTKIVDDVSIVHVFGLDLAENGEILGTALIPDYSVSAEVDHILAVEEQVPAGVLFIPEMSRHTSTRVELAKIRVIVFGKDFAENGVKDMVDRFIFTPELGTNIQIAVTTHTANETLKTFMQEQSLTLIDRIEHNMIEQGQPQMNLHYFLNQFYGEGMDAYVPMITIDNQNRIKVDGIGIISKSKLKLHLPEKETSLFSLIKDKRAQATYHLDLGEKRDENITLRGFRSKSEWEWNKEKDEVTLNLKLKVTLTQHPNRFDLSKTEDLQKIKKLIAKELEEDIHNLLATFKENEVDPLGIGNIVRSKDRTWEKESFYRKYPDIPIHVNVDVGIIHSGLEN
ncbi:germination protein XA [Ornithinibacillus halotolerans]|uniref:Germination protein XA n=1 Tax=Ornithinibacillus halotolerans TaxID=1274357 RepID=A0A916W3S1_9BACI|nr:germination protein XA [Ornithinibacillus halotolerans]